MSPTNLPEPSRRRTVPELVAEARRLDVENQIQVGRDLRKRRRRRRMSQVALAVAAGMSREMVKRMESGRGGAIPGFRWHAVALAPDTTHDAEFARDHQEEPADAGHLSIQELLLRLGAALGFDKSVELPTRSSDPSRSIDVSLRNDRRRVLMVLEA